MIKESKLLMDGQGMFCDTIKTALYVEDNTIFERLDFEGDTIFLEPMLFGHCIKKYAKNLKEQILFGYYLPKNRSEKIQVYTNAKGVVYLPNYGYLTTNEEDTCLKLNYNTDLDEIVLKKEDSLVVFEMEEIVYLESIPTIELSNSIDVYSKHLFEEFFTEDPTIIIDLLRGEEVNLTDFKPAIEEAFMLLNKYFPEEFKKYALVTRKIVLFSSSKLLSIVTRETHGVIYLNVNEHSNVTFFLEELIHQCSHIVFNAMTYDTQQFFKVDYNQTVGQYIGNNDYRTLYSALHGIYTTGQIVSLLLQLIKSKPSLNKEIGYELIGRIAINKKRHNIGLEKVSLEGVFTKKGQKLFAFYYNQLDKNIQENPSFFKYNVKEQPVVFNYQKFKKDNPLPKSLSSLKITE